MACLAVVLVLSDFDRLMLQRVAVKSTVDVEIKVPSDEIQSCYRFSLSNCSRSENSFGFLAYWWVKMLTFHADFCLHGAFTFIFAQSSSEIMCCVLDIKQMYLCFDDSRFSLI